jgi:ASCH domain-containing protein
MEPVATIRALSVRQPWANLIARGVKTIELRSWDTDYRGELAICAGKEIDREGAARMRCAPSELRPRGAIVCVVDLVDIRPLTRHDWKAACALPFSGSDLDFLCAWVLERPRRVEPVAVSGKLGLFELNGVQIRYR